MRAIIFPEPETISLEQIEDPVCGADDVIVKVAACGICGTDLQIYRNEYMSGFPLIPGHEFTGEIVEVGRNVEDFQLSGLPSRLDHHRQLCPMLHLPAGHRLADGGAWWMWSRWSATPCP